MKKIIVTNEQIKEIKQYINESPDRVIVDNYKQIAGSNDSDSVCFAFDNKAYIGLNDELFWDENGKISEYTQEKFDTLGVYVKRYFYWHIGLGDFYDFLGEKNNLSTERSELKYPGRLWFRKKIISFWKYPDKTLLPKLLNLLSSEFKNLYGVNIDFSDYKIDVIETGVDWEKSAAVGKLIPLLNYEGSLNVNSVDLQNIHTLLSNEKQKTPQMQSVKQYNANKLADKFNGGISQAEWNNAKKKFQGESIIKEDPDTIRHNNKIYCEYSDDDAIAFGIFNGKAYVSYNKALAKNSSNFNSDSDFYYKFYNNHFEIGNFYDNAFNVHIRASNKYDFQFAGRLWFSSKIISFWNYPNDLNELEDVMNLVRLEIKNVYQTNLFFSEYYIEVKNSVEGGGFSLIPFKDYNGSVKLNDVEMSKIHLLPSDEKQNTKQMQDVKNFDNNINSSKFVNTSKAAWNAAKSKSIGESIANITEIESSDINLASFELKKDLNEKFWVNKKLNSQVRRRLLKIADDFLDFINVDSKYCKDILFLGSLTNYNWSKYSDVDLHLLIDFSKINKDIELVKDYFDVKRKLWNSEHDSLKIYGFPVELYVQDIKENNSSSSIFSLEKNKWLKVPDNKQFETLDKSKIKQKASDIITKIDDLKSIYDKKPNLYDLEDTSKKVKSLFDKIKKMRKSGLESDDGEFSVGNIVFKVLRRSGYLEILVDLKRNTYDKINTIK